MAMLLHGAATAQQGRWDWRGVTYNGTSKYGARVHVDPWGRTHLVWGAQALWSTRDDWQSRDWTNSRAGYQLFYTSDATGDYSNPTQATDATSGSVFLRDLKGCPWTFRVDKGGGVHLAFVANANGHPSLFYATNAPSGDLLFGNLHRRFITTSAITDLAVSSDTLGFDMAVDSNGMAHLAWIEWRDAQAQLFYTSLRESWQPVLLGNMDCYGGNGGCLVGTPDIEINRAGLATVVVRKLDGGKGGIRIVRQQPDGRFEPIRWVQALPYGNVLDGVSRADLRIRMAIDSVDAVHLLLPYADAGKPIRHRLLYVYCDTGKVDPSTGIDNGTMVGDARPLIEAPLDTIASDFDLAYNGGIKLDVVWSTQRKLGTVRAGFAELTAPTPMLHGIWETNEQSQDMTTKIGAPPFARTDLRVGAVGDRVVISGVYEPPNLPASERGVTQTMTISRSSTRPVIQYVHPDAAAAGMSVVVEAFAHPSALGSFGADSLGGGAGRIEVADMNDTARVVVGPTVVSWDGRLAQAMIIVKPGAAAGPVPLRIRVGSLLSNIDTFTIVEPVKIEALHDGGVLGAGTRSRRGVIVFDSLHLSRGVFTIDTSDCDPTTPGNQGFLPVTILSRGPIVIESGAVLRVSGSTDVFHKTTAAGPGGGGGGSGRWLAAGSGFTGGGGIGLIDDHPLRGASVGSGSEHSGYLSGGGSVGGTPGGASFVDAPGGGGTAHPFGSSGWYGQMTATNPVERNSGGAGGGSAGSLTALQANLEVTAGGGGGGNAENGQSGDDQSGLPRVNGGHAVGSRQLVPLAGGSGGGGGGCLAGGNVNGGSGGGAIAIISNGTIRIDGSIEADGSDGIAGEGTDAGGGGGSGGAVLIAAQDSVVIGARGHVYARGGLGGAAPARGSGARGGNGSLGRLRFDGRVAATATGALAPATYFNGPGCRAGHLMQANAGMVISGFATRDSVLKIWKSPDGVIWRSDLIRADAAGEWRDTLDPGDVSAGRVYVVAMQRVTRPSRQAFLFEPTWVMSSAGAMIVGNPGIDVSADSLDLGCIQYRTCSSTTVTIENSGDVGDLVVTGMHISGPDSSRFLIVGGSSQLTVGAGSSIPVGIRFCPADTGHFRAQLVLETNLGGASERRVALIGCGSSGRWSPSKLTVDLGSMCAGTCRDTFVTVTNVGDAPMVVERVSADNNDVGVTLPGTTLPLTLPPGAKRVLPMRVCMRRVGDADALVRMESNTIDSALVIMVHATNALPTPVMPVLVDLGKVNVSGASQCVDQEFVIVNRSTTSTITAEQIGILPPQFQLLSARPADMRLAPGDTLHITMRFCPDAARIYSAGLQLKFSGAGCSLDTSIHLQGTGTLHQARYELVAVDSTARSIQFPPTLVTATSPSAFVTVRNSGDAPGGPVSVTLSGQAGDVVVTGTIDGIPVGAQRRLEVAMRPSAVGAIDASMHLTSTDPLWGDRVDLHVRGILPGLQTDPLSIDFGALCLGTPQERTIRVFNSGTAPDTVTDVSIAAAGFQVIPDAPLPWAMPGGSEHSIVVRFIPTTEAAAAGTVVVARRSDVLFMVPVNGAGKQGHLHASIDRLDFGCRSTASDSTIFFTLVNTGDCSISIDGIPVTGSPGAFTVDAPSMPLQLAGGKTLSLPVHYHPGTSSATGRISIETSAPELVFVDLAGDVCNRADVWKLSLTVPDATARVNDTLTLPIHASISPAAPFEIPFEVTITYAYDLLRPRIDTRIDAVPQSVWGNGAIGNNLTMSEAKPGVLTVSGTIAAGATDGALVNIPFRVLLGSTHTTAIAVDRITLTSPGVSGTAKKGLFVATGCDTANIIVTGSYILDQNVPNPFNPSTVIRYAIARRDRVRLNLYDASGNFVRTEIDQEQGPGVYLYRLDATSLPSGIYTYEIISGRFRMTRRMVLME